MIGAISMRDVKQMWRMILCVVIIAGLLPMQLMGQAFASAEATATQVEAGGAEGGAHSLILKSDGTVWATGGNQYGQLGDGTTTNRSTPVQANITSVVYVAAGKHHSLALKSDGTVWAWGANHSGQLGDGTMTDACDC
jgi:alpha-tubulin suppressor-like RCC1 family protein